MSKKIFFTISLLTVFSFLIFSNLSFAINIPTEPPQTEPTVAELQAKIAALLEQIRQLQEQIARLQGQRSQWCYTFNHNLKIGMSGIDVKNLHIALEKEGFFINLEEKEKYSFGESTASAVSGFQEKYRQEILVPLGLKYGTGYVGESTRKKLNSLYGCKTSQVCIEVITPAQNPLTGECKNFPTPCDVPAGWITVNNCPTIQCQYLYWYDDNTRYCQGPKQFCGLYMYQGLRVFKTKEECEASLRENINPYITELLPNMGKQGETVEIIIKGYNLTGAKNNSACGINPIESKGFELLSCQEISDNQINAKFFISQTAEIGERKINVCVPNKGCSNYLTFKVVSSLVVSCFDSDGGKNYSLKGSVTQEGKTYTDYCVSSSILKEYWCTQISSIGLGGVAEEDYTCPSGTVCKDGACVKMPLPSITVLSPNGGEVWTEGNTYEIKWKYEIFNVNLYQRKVRIQWIHPDALAGGEVIASGVPAVSFCTASGDCTGIYKWTIPYNLTQFTNSNRKNLFKIQITDEGTDINSFDISDGYFTISPSSISVSCFDSDGGKNYSLKGSVTQEGKTYTDYCVSSSILKEYWCTQISSIGLGGVAEEDYTCPSGTVCKDGACVKVQASTQSLDQLLLTPMANILAGAKKLLEEMAKVLSR